MRVPVICLAVLFAVILALPETTGAPTNPGSETYKREEQNSRRVAKEGEESDDSYETTKNVNGLISGSKGQCKDKRSSELEEEQSSLSEEYRTANGVRKTGKAKRQKKVVTNSEHKEVLVYYMVSYKNLPRQRQGECRMAYYKRIFPVEDDLKVFYHKIFKHYEREQTKEYIDRVEYILNNVYPELDPRLDVKWVEEFDHYYTLKYSRKANECDGSYFPRVLAKESGESTEHYKQRMTCLVTALDEEDYSHIIFDDSVLGYKIGERKSNVRSTSGQSGGQASSQINSSTLKSKAQEESLDESETTIENVGRTSISSASKKHRKKKRTTVDKEVQSKSYTFRMAYNQLPARIEGETLTAYYKRYFGECSLKDITPQAKDEFYIRMLIQYKGETLKEYIARVDYLFNTVYPEFDIRTNSEFSNLLLHYYRTKYALQSGETQQQWCIRVLKKQSGETTEKYKQRVACLKAAVTGIDWTTITIDESSSQGYTIVSRGSSTGKSKRENCRRQGQKQKQHGKNVRRAEDKRAKYGQNIKELDWRQKQHGDNVGKCNKRKQEHERHVKDVEERNREHEQNAEEIQIRGQEHYNNVREIGRKNKEHEENVKKWIKANYQKKSCEDMKAYYERICTNSFKTKGEYLERITSVRSVFNDLDLWYDERYLCYTRNYYNAVYAKKTTETEEEYFKRLLTKESYESEETFAKRVNIVRSIFPSLRVWHDKKYYEKYSKTFYQTYYKKKDTESVKDYLNRVYKKSDSESEQNYWKRVLLIQETFPEYHYWYDAKYLQEIEIFKTLSKVKSETELEEWMSTDEEDEEVLKIKRQCLKKIFDSPNTRNELYSQGSVTKSVAGSEDVQVTKYVVSEDIQKKYYKLEGEDSTTYINRLTKEFTKIQNTKEYLSIVKSVYEKYPELDLWYDVKHYELFKTFFTNTYQKTTGETETDYFNRILIKKSYETDKIYISRIELLQKVFPTISLWSDNTYYEKYLKSYYLSVYKKLSSEDVATYYARLISNCEESDFAFITRINFIRWSYPTLDLWYDSKYYSLVKKYYTSVYQKKTVETKEIYFKRILNKETYETEELYFKRLQVVQKIFPTLECWSADEYYEHWMKPYIQYVYRKISSEDLDVYYARLIRKFDEESDELYVKRLSLVKRSFSDIPLWYDAKYYDLVKKYYVIFYSKKSGETEDEYFKRFVLKESCETDEIYVKKIQILQKAFPTLSLWSDEVYYKYTKECYQKLYKKLDCETEEKYFSRIVYRFVGECDAAYIARLALIQRTYRCLALWYNDKYYDLVKEYYTKRYVQKSGECEETYVKRLLFKEKGDSTDSIYVKRIHLIHLSTISSSVWFNEKFSSYFKSYYESYYKKVDGEKCADWLKRVFTVIPGECEPNAIKRIALIKKYTNYNCWNLEILKEIETCFATSYIKTIKESFFACESGKISSSSKKSKKSSSSHESEEDEFVEVSRD